ncbi:MAG TPA: hypothetical protein VFW34_07840 [Candidatus Rubrimentiphilum sp.]|nr:hypothetical protein [Candidatus Rubrimentiphilum sp.]
MFTTFQRAGILTVALCMAAGATAFATVTIEPSNSITLQPRGRGMNNSDPDRENVTITAVSHSGKVQITENTCRGLADVSGVKAGLSETTGSGRPAENEYYATLHLQTKTQEGNCAVSFSDGSHTATARIRIAKP